MLIHSGREAGINYWAQCSAGDAVLSTTYSWLISLKAVAPVFVVTPMKTEF